MPASYLNSRSPIEQRNITIFSAIFFDKWHDNIIFSRVTETFPKRSSALLILFLNTRTRLPLLSLPSKPLSIILAPQYFHQQCDNKTATCGCHPAPLPDGCLPAEFPQAKHICRQRSKDVGSPSEPACSTFQLLALSYRIPPRSEYLQYCHCPSLPQASVHQNDWQMPKCFSLFSGVRNGKFKILHLMLALFN